MRFICEGLISNHFLKRLNLSRNYLTNLSGEPLKSVLKNSYLSELYLHWNQIKAAGGTKIFQGLMDNDFVQVLDLSWNSLGGGNPSIAPVISELLQSKNTDRLAHLDLSNNYFTLEESKIIANGLENNHSVFGFHFGGNHGYVDSKGFLIVHDGMGKDLSEMHLNRRIAGWGFGKGGVKLGLGCNVTLGSAGKKKHLEEMRDRCWLCDGWSSFKFEWIPG